MDTYIDYKRDPTYVDGVIADLPLGEDPQRAVDEDGAPLIGHHYVPNGHHPPGFLWAITRKLLRVRMLGMVFVKWASDRYAHHHFKWDDSGPSAGAAATEALFRRRSDESDSGKFKPPVDDTPTLGWFVDWAAEVEREAKREREEDERRHDEERRAAERLRWETDHEYRATVIRERERSDYTDEWYRQRGFNTEDPHSAFFPAPGFFWYLARRKFMKPWSVVHYLKGRVRVKEGRVGDPVEGHVGEPVEAHHQPEEETDGLVGCGDDMQVG